MGRIYQFKLRTGRIVERKMTYPEAYEYATKPGMPKKMHIWGTKKELAKYKKQHPAWWRIPKSKARPIKRQPAPKKRRPRARRIDDPFAGLY